MILTHGILVRPKINHISKKHADFVVCTVERSHGEWWKCIVVLGDDTYPVGGWDLSVHADDIRNGIRYGATPVTNEESQ